MKSIVRITRRLMSLFLVLVASSIMFLPSPAIAATSSWTIVNSNNLGELLNSTESAIVLLVSKRERRYFVEELKEGVEKYFGDKYKYVGGAIEENSFLYRNSVGRPAYLNSPALVAVKNGVSIKGIFIDPNDLRNALVYIQAVSLDNKEEGVSGLQRYENLIDKLDNQLDVYVTP